MSPGPRADQRRCEKKPVSRSAASAAATPSTTATGKWFFSDGVGAVRTVNYGTATVAGRQAVVFTWYRIAENDTGNADFLYNTLQIVLVKRATGDSTVGFDFDIEFNYGTLQDDEDGYSASNPASSCTAYSSYQPTGRDNCRWGVGTAGYIASLKSQNPFNVVVGAGDLIGASPLVSALFYDEGTIEVLNRVGLEISSVGNHEFDKGFEFLTDVATPRYGAGDPRQGVWGPENKGSWVDVRNTDNLRAMRDTSVYLFAEETGHCGERIQAYYEARAAGGAGLLIMGVCAVAYPAGTAEPWQVGVSRDDFIPGLAQLAERVHKHGAKIAMQLQHAGKVSVRDMAAGRELWVPSMPSRVNSDIMAALTAEELENFVSSSRGIGGGLGSLGGFSSLRGNLQGFRSLRGGGAGAQALDRQLPAIARGFDPAL